jgi:phospholipid:diacylglycerol acyltransferase
MVSVLRLLDNGGLNRVPKRKRWNPAGIKITTVEIRVLTPKVSVLALSASEPMTGTVPHKSEITLPRGGANTSDYVDIFGSNALNEIVLKVATGVRRSGTTVSRIREYAKRICWDG